MLFDRNSRSKPRGKFGKTAFLDVGKPEKIANYETKVYRKDPLEKAKDFLESYEDPIKSVTHEKNSDGKYERNVHIIKMIIRAVFELSQRTRFFK